MSRPVSSIYHRIAKQLLWVLLPALLITQWAGFAHRISHGGGTVGNTTYSVSSSTSNSFSFHILIKDDNRLHSCSLFDAATLAECVHLPVLAIAPNNAIDAMAVLLSTKVWLAQPELHFSSRAPPTQLS